MRRFHITCGDNKKILASPTEASVRDAFCIPLNRSILLQAYDGEFEDFVDIEFENLNKCPAKRLKVIVRGTTQDFGNPNYILPDASCALPDIQSGHNGLINESLDAILPCITKIEYANEMDSSMNHEMKEVQSQTDGIHSQMFLNSSKEPNILQYAKGTQNISKDWNGLQLQEMPNDCSPNIDSSALTELKM